MMALNKSNTALTVIPTSLNGSRRSQTIGYRIKPRIARGQQSTSKINQSTNFKNMVSSFESISGSKPGLE
jgi:hypothetical protein